MSFDPERSGRQPSPNDRELRSFPEPGDEDPPRALAEILTGRHLRLRSLRVQDYEGIYEWAAVGSIPWQWQGRPIGPDGFQQTLWAGVLAHFVIEKSNGGQPIGLVTAYGANFHHQHCYIQMGVVPTARLQGWPIEAGLLAINFLFERHNFHKIYGEVTGGSLALFRSAMGQGFEIEGCLKDHVFVDGQFRDMYILGITRRTWTDRIKPVVGRLRDTPSVGSP